MPSFFDDIGGFLFGNGGKDKTTSNSTTNATTNSSAVINPYAPVQGSLQQFIDSLGGTIGNTGNVNSYGQQGFEALNAAAGNAPGNLQPSITANNQYASGQMLDPNTNPYLQALGAQVGGQAASTANATFGGAGRTGSGLHEYYVGKGVGDALSNLYGSQFNQQQNLQQQAIANAPGLNQATLAAPQAQIGASQNANTNLSNILSQIAGLGGTTNTNTVGNTTTQAQTLGQKGNYGLVGNYISSLF